MVKSFNEKKTGSPAAPYSYPWMVLLQSIKNISNPGNAYWCGGSLISNEWICKSNINSISLFLN